jgi:uncharacterized membrane protein YedE/YeeE
MGMGMLAAYLRSNNAVVRAVVEAGVDASATSASSTSYIGAVVAVFMFSSALFALPSYLQAENISNEGQDDMKSHSDLIEHAVSFVSAFLFGLGLIYSGMSDPQRVMGFLDVTRKQGWDVTLIGVMGGGVLFNLVSFQYLVRNVKAIVMNPTKMIKAIITMGPFSGKNAEVDMKLIVGSVLFGVGWGLTGICPGPAIVLLGTQAPGGEVMFSAISMGMVVFELVAGRGSPWFDAGRRVDEGKGDE